MLQILFHFSSVLKIGCNSVILDTAVVLLLNGGSEGSAPVLQYPIKQRVLKLDDLHMMQDIFKKQLREEKYQLFNSIKQFCAIGRLGDMLK